MFIIGYLRGRPTTQVLPIIGDDQETTELPNRVKKRQNKHGVAIYQRSRGFNNGGLKDIAPTLTKNSYEHNNHVVVKSNTKAVYNGVAIRKLTPHEFFRLQGFPDDFFDRARAVNSDSQLYKQAGNSVTVNVIYEIAKRFE